MRRLIWPPGFLVLVLFLGACATGPLLPNMELARANSTARVVYSQATELRLDGFISDDAWTCIKQLQLVVDAALDAGDVALAQSQTRLLRRAAREDFNACS